MIKAMTKMIMSSGIPIEPNILLLLAWERQKHPEEL
jgi:hypothetical protein